MFDVTAGVLVSADFVYDAAASIIAMIGDIAGVLVSDTGGVVLRNKFLYPQQKLGKKPKKSHNNNRRNLSNNRLKQKQINSKRN